MPSIVVPNAIELRLLWTLDITPWAVNVLHFTIPGGSSVNQAMANAARTAVETAYKTDSTQRANTHTSWRLNQVGVRDLRTANQPEYFAPLTDQTGLAGGDRLSPLLAACVTLRTPLAGRSYRGRVYVPGYTETANAADGTITGAVTQASRTFVTAIGTRVGAALGATHVVVSRKLLTSQPVTTYQTRNSLWAVQRRRRTGLASF